MKISYSVIKDLYENLFSFDIPKKELVKKFLADKEAIIAYVSDLKHDIKIMEGLMDASSYKKGIIELTELSLSL